MAPCQKLQSWGNSGSSCTPISGLDVMKFHVELKLLGQRHLCFPWMVIMDNMPFRLQLEREEGGFSWDKAGKVL